MNNTKSNDVRVGNYSNMSYTYVSLYLHIVLSLVHQFQRLTLEKKGWIPMMNRWQQGSAGEGPRAAFGTWGTRGRKNRWKTSSRCSEMESYSILQ